MESEILLSVYTLVVVSSFFSWIFVYVYAAKANFFDDCTDSAKENLHISGTSIGSGTNDYRQSGTYTIKLFNYELFNLFFTFPSCACGVYYLPNLILW